MNLNQNTLVEFEERRYESGYIPPDESNSYYDIGNSRINLFTMRDDPEDPRFDIYVEEGTAVVGQGTFNVSGDIIDPSKPYNSFTILNGAGISVDDRIIVNKGKMNIHGEVDLNNGSNLISNNEGSIIFYPDSKLTIHEGSQLTVESGAEIKIYGEVDIHLTVINILMGNENIFIDTAAVINVSGIDLGDRDYSITDYAKDLQNTVINKYTRSEINTEHGRVGYVWKDGNPQIGSTILELDVLYGDIILGDYKVSILGLQNTYRENLMIFESIRVYSGATLYISDHYEDQRFLNPNLYLGIVIGNTKRTAHMRIDGNVVVDGKDSSLTVDRKSTLYISEGGVLELKNDGKLISAYNDDTVTLFIYGTLIIDKIEQITSFDPENIIFGDNGKIIILNNYEEENKILFSTPNGKFYTDLYRLFSERLDKVEYHIQPNTGLKIDYYFEFYSRDLTDWYAGIRIEKAIFNKMIIWHDNAFIELDNEIIPWATVDATLLEASRLFKSYGSFDKQKLQEVVERLKYAGSGDVRFRIVSGDNTHEVFMKLTGLKLNSIVGKSGMNSYIVNTDGEGEMFLKNLVSVVTLQNVVNDQAKVVELQDGDTVFSLDE